MPTFNYNAYRADSNNVRDQAVIPAVANLPPRELRFVKRLCCVDGLSFSAQANSTAYCVPRDDAGPWTAVEVGFPSQKVEEFMPYAENPASPTDTVYGYVPVEVVEQVVDDHGGLVPAPPELIRYDSPDQIFE